MQCYVHFLSGPDNLCLFFACTTRSCVFEQTLGSNFQKSACLLQGAMIYCPLYKSMYKPSHADCTPASETITPHRWSKRKRKPDSPPLAGFFLLFSSPRPPQKPWTQKIESSCYILTTLPKTTDVENRVILPYSTEISRLSAEIRTELFFSTAPRKILGKPLIFYEKSNCFRSAGAKSAKFNGRSRKPGSTCASVLRPKVNQASPPPLSRRRGTCLYWFKACIKPCKGIPGLLRNDRSPEFVIINIRKSVGDLSGSFSH